ncbi:MAG: hypothetical protein ACI9ME_000943 [Ilumatobacter sp.]|jgi:hypothetical protein
MSAVMLRPSRTTRVPSAESSSTVIEELVAHVARAAGHRSTSLPTTVEPGESHQNDC